MESQTFVEAKMDHVYSPVENAAVMIKIIIRTEIIRTYFSPPLSEHS